MNKPNKKGRVSQFSIFANCKKYGLSPWQCPQFLFLVMGIVIIATEIISYAFGTRYITDPIMVVLLVSLLTVVLFIITFTIVRGFERLAEANRMKSEFISVVSHQLRSPLSNLNWSIEFLMSKKLGDINEKQGEYFKILKENSDRMKDLVNDLLTVSRLETTKLVPSNKETDVDVLVKTLIAEFQPLIKASEIILGYNPSQNLPKVSADSSQLKMVIENLIDNAVKYANGGGKINIKLEKRNGNIYFEVEDNGVGVPEEDKKYLFQKFFRSQNALRHQTQGSGLGLYIAKSIVERSGGKIGFKSEENKGSTFWFTFPIKA
ncbi:MAG: HAMP domain-containing sensor histidine kinase [Candidatus Nealsonbacteria bacterium]